VGTVTHPGSRWTIPIKIDAATLSAAPIRIVIDFAQTLNLRTGQLIDPHTLTLGRVGHTPCRLIHAQHLIGPWLDADGLALSQITPTSPPD
jgi:hypothetical protein